MISIWSAKNFTPLSWFSAGQQGAWYDPGDLTTLYQDSAGTTPVTAVEQPVGKMLDKSGRGNHAIQATASNKPTLSARVNALTYSQDFSNAAWSKVGTGVVPPSVTANSVLAPDGTLTGSRIDYPSVSIGTNFSFVYQAPAQSFLTAHTGAVYLKGAVGGEIIWLSWTISGAAAYSRTQCVLTTDWQRFTVNYTTTASGSQFFQIGVDLRDSLQSARPAQTIYAWGADLRPTNAGALLPTYQRVNAATNYDTVGFPVYLKCVNTGIAATSSSMATNSIDFTATNQMTVVSGVRKLSDAGQGILSELSATSATNNGSFTLSAPAGASANYSWLSKGTIADTITSGTFTAPITNVISGLSSIGAPSNAMRINGTVQSTNSNSEGTGNYGNYPLYLFARAGTSLWFNGQFYGAIIVGQTQTTQQIQQAEQYMATKTGISF